MTNGPSGLLRTRIAKRHSERFGRLWSTAGQHSERVSKVLAAQYVAELENLTADIPHGERLPVRADNAALVKAGKQRAPCNLAERLVETPGRGGSTVALLGHVGNVEIDLRDAVIPVDGLDVRVSAYLGDVTVVVPPNVQVSLLATPPPGRAVDDTGSATAAPTVRIRALVLFGDINVQTEALCAAHCVAQVGHSRRGDGVDDLQADLPETDAVE
jgi:hypothetical protein